MVARFELANVPYAPDLGLNGGHLVANQAMVPLGNVQVPWGRIKEVSDRGNEVGGTPWVLSSGAQVVRHDDGVVYVYVALDDGSSTHILQVDTSTSPYTINTVTPVGIPTTPGAKVDFCTLGNYFIFCGDGIPVKVYDNNNVYTQVTDLITSGEKPQGLYCEVFANRLWLANISNITISVDSLDPGSSASPHLLWGSVFDNATDFDIATGAIQVLYQDGYGPLTGLCSPGEYMLVFKEGVVYRLDQGGPFGWENSAVPNSYGTKYYRSIVPWGDDVYFWSSDGPARYRNGTVEILGWGRISRTLVSDDWHDNPALTNIQIDDSVRGKDAVVGLVDSGSENVVWFYCDQAADTLDRAVVYSPQTDRFTTSPVKPFTDLAGTPTTSTIRTAYSYSAVRPSGLEFNDLELMIYEPSEVEEYVIVGFDPSGTRKIDVNPSVRFGYIDPHGMESPTGRSHLVVGVRVDFETRDANVMGYTVNIRGKSRPDEEGTILQNAVATGGAVDGAGWVRFSSPIMTTHSSVEVTFTGETQYNIALIRAVEVEYELLEDIMPVL